MSLNLTYMQLLCLSTHSWHVSNVYMYELHRIPLGLASSPTSGCHGAVDHLYHTQMCHLGGLIGFIGRLFLNTVCF